jgi:hypothetical protein
MRNMFMALPGTSAGKMEFIAYKNLMRFMEGAW